MNPKRKVNKATAPARKVKKVTARARAKSGPSRKTVTRRSRTPLAKSRKAPSRKKNFRLFGKAKRKPACQCKTTCREKCTCKRASKRKNPVVPKKVANLFQEFQGRATRAVKSLFVPNGAPRDVATLGKLIEIRLVNRGVLRFNNNPATLGATPTGRRLVIGLSKPYALPNGEGSGKSIDLGPIKYVVYKTRKPHLDDGRVHEYIHNLGEEGGKRPHLMFKNGLLSVKGGDYTITAEGIRD